jgi:hypothetical protein
MYLNESASYNKMLIEKLPEKEKAYYQKMLGAIGALSKLFSDSDIPYLEYRLAENLFCRSFNAQNVSRSDVSVDAVFKDVGIGIKTFQGNSAQKIAEFNKDLVLYSDLNDKDKIKKISELRNKRIEATKRTYELKELIYHCIKRKQGKVIIHEYPMSLIDVSNIKNVERKRNNIHFNDGKNKYQFNLSKSVLMKKFDEENPSFEFEIKIIDDPFKIIEETILELIEEKKLSKALVFVILPLYSKRGGVHVPEKSGLNQWNAKGRTDKKGTISQRHKNEVYIPVPIWVHKAFSDFFPSKDKSFNLALPNGKVISAKMCQANEKGLMSNPNKVLGEWILRDILQLKDNELATYEKLIEIGVDSVIVEKIDDSNYKMDFRELGTFEQFEEDNPQKSN